MKSTHILTEKYDTRRKLANRVLKAMNDISECDNGTIRNPYELASIVLPDGRTLIETIYEDGEVMYNDGWYIVEVDEYCMYVDLTGFACKEMGVSEYECISDFEEETEEQNEKEESDMRTEQITKKEALNIVFNESPIICVRFDRRKKQIKHVLEVFSIEELKTIEQKKIERYNRNRIETYQPIMSLKHDINLFKRNDNYRKGLIDGNTRIYWAHPEYKHQDYNKSVFVLNTPTNRKRMQLINAILNK